jgi:hypothetical protein
VTTALEPARSDHAAVGGAAVVALGRTESRRMLRHPAIWIGFTLSILLAVVEARNRQDWSSQKYVALVPLSIFPLTMAVLVAAVGSGNRDRSHHQPPLAEEAALDGDARAWARLASLVVPVTMAALLMLVIGVVSRIEGGFWMGDGRARTDTAVHSVFELLQPALVVAVVGAASMAVGRAVRWTGPSIVVGMVLLFFSLGPYWLWNNDVLYPMTLVQVQPLGSEPSARVHIPTVILHDLYLLGLTAVFVGLSLRRPPRRRLVGAGAVIAIGAVVCQFVVSPI